jgi:ubiquinone/menaquinone biosynthesis C-methylase UbiE
MRLQRKKALYLPDRNLMVKTNEDDPVDYYYKLMTGWLYRKRLEIGTALLGNDHRHRILEIGYGSGVLLPILAASCDELYGVDIHENIPAVAAMLAVEGIRANLVVGNILDLDYPQGVFDAVISLSVLEHLIPHDLTRALKEVRRVLQPGGVAVFGFPVRNVVTNAFYRLVGFNPMNLHPSAHREIVEAVQVSFKRIHVTWFPRWVPMDLALYIGVRSE